MSGEVPVLATAAAGTVVRVWVTRDGQLTEAPLQDTQVASQADFAATFGVVALAVTLTATGVLARRALDEHRMAASDADWRVTGRRWTHGHQGRAARRRVGTAEGRHGRGKEPL